MNNLKLDHHENVFTSVIFMDTQLKPAMIVAAWAKLSVTSRDISDLA